MNKLVKKEETEVFDLSTFDADDFSSLSVLDSTGLLGSTPQNIVSIEGKLFTLKFADGKEETVGSELECVILNASKYDNRSYFEGDRTDENSKLLCSSANGLAPDSWITWEEKPTSCALCPKNAKGSSKDGKARACKTHKYMAILTESYPTTPFLIRMPVTSLMSFKAYVRDLTSQFKAAGVLKDASATAPLHLIKTKLSFKLKDHEGKIAAYPIIDFSRVGMVGKELFQPLTEMAKSEEVKKLIKIDDESIAAHVAPTAPVQIERGEVKDTPITTPTPHLSTKSAAAAKVNQVLTDENFIV